MYNQSESKILQQQTQQWLAFKDSKTISEKIAAGIDNLRNVLRFHEYRYYVLNNPHLADAEYDLLYKLLENYEKNNPSSITPNSPTQRVGVAFIKDFPKRQHLVPMLSLENSYNAEDLLDWDRKARELSGLSSIEYCVEPKFDGASISVIYENDLLMHGVTRGDGETGDDITPNIRQIKSLPLSALFSNYGIAQIEIRGEVLMNKNNFKKYNDGLMEEGLPPLANPRNAAAGSLRIKETAEVRKRNLEAFLYHVSYFTAYNLPFTLNDKKIEKALNSKPATHSTMLEMLWNLGFRSPKAEMTVVEGIDAVTEHIQAYEEKRDNLPYEIDGMVIKVNDLNLQEKLGMTSHHPRWAIAFKFKARQATSKLILVDFQVGRTGAVTPVAKIQPVQVGGVTVSSISIHNEEYIKEKNLMLGDAILIERSGDVIPQIVKSLPELRDGNEKKIIFPKKCPVCKEQLYKAQDEAVWRCTNINCEAQVVERIIHFAGKNAMDIRSLGDANIRKFYQLGLLKSVSDIYQFPFEAVKSLEGFGTKSIENLQTAIENSKQQPLHRFIYALGIRYVGETTAKSLAQAVNNIFDLSAYSLEKLQQLDDIGVKVASSIFDFFKNLDNIKMLYSLQELGLNMSAAKATKSGNLTGQTFLFTGTLEKMKRTEAEELVEKNGGKIIGSVSSKLNYLVVGAEAGSKLEKAKKISSVKILTEEDFLQMIQAK